MKELETIIEKQKDFQRFVNFPIDSNLESDRNELSEKFIYKLIEECIELRKEAPSAMNPWSKKQKEADMTRIKEEMSDIFLFFCNIMITWRISPSEILSQITQVQEQNFVKVKERKMKMLNEQILNIPGYSSCVGDGNLTPKYVFIGQNPSHEVGHGGKTSIDETNGLLGVLLPILDTMGIRQDCYFTNIVKSTTIDGIEPSNLLTNFWNSTLIEELDILRKGNPGMKIITMGTYASNALTTPTQINHPTFVLRGGITKEKYEEQIKEAIR